MYYINIYGIKLFNGIQIMVKTKLGPSQNIFRSVENDVDLNIGNMANAMKDRMFGKEL